MSEIYYGEFYGFRTAPFHVTPDASLLFPTATHQAALGAIEYGIKAGKGFVVVTGQVGVGKTTVLRSCLDNLDSSRTRLIYLYNPDLTTVELYNTLLEELDPELAASVKSSDTLRALLRALLETHQAGTEVILAVDEAQNMPDQTLESLRILSNLETTHTKLLQILLVGQPELDAKLRKHSLRQLRQRIAVRARIRPLTFRESRRYIRHRALRAGRRSARNLFTRPALWYLASAARGIPRTINICCDNALINGYGHAAQRINLRIAREVCSSLGYRAPLWRVPAIIAALVLLCCGVLLAGAWLPGLPGTSLARLATLVQRHELRIVAPVAAAANAVATAINNASGPTPTPSPSAAPPPDDSTAPNMASASADAVPAPADGGSPNMASASAGRVSAPADTRTAVAAHAAGHDAAGATSSAGAARTVATTQRRHWLVSRGDSVYKACLRTYGYCDKTMLHAVLADNPQLPASAVVYPGDVLVLPATIGALRARP
ncbi:MAG TPA: AAA family ATPase [Steroidobacteraceae bacterium]|jgi:general secretion pathway protein A|nr:AAA family ATPase [Steroidobacteraceae bacterium]